MDDIDMLLLRASNPRAYRGVMIFGFICKLIAPFNFIFPAVGIIWLLCIGYWYFAIPAIIMILAYPRKITLLCTCPSSSLLWLIIVSCAYPAILYALAINYAPFTATPQFFFAPM